VENVDQRTVSVPGETLDTESERWMQWIPLNDGRRRAPVVEQVCRLVKDRASVIRNQFMLCIGLQTATKERVAKL
jgi:hypothetical protein